LRRRQRLGHRPRGPPLRHRRVHRHPHGHDPPRTPKGPRMNAIQASPDYAHLLRPDGRTAGEAGAGGIAREAALALAAHGARLVIADLSLDAAQATVAAIAERGGEAEAYRLDVLDDAEVEAAAARFGDASALVFTAAMNVRKRME